MESIKEFDTNSHSVYMLHYHLIMCIKYRKRVIDDEISERLKEIFLYIAPSYHITLEEWNHDIDHVHILFRGQPNTEISKFINIKRYIHCQCGYENDRDINAAKNIRREGLRLLGLA